MADFIYENTSTGAIHKLSGTPPVDPAGKIPGGDYRVYLMGSGAPAIAKVPSSDTLDVVCWGDSLTAGAGAPAGDDYPAQAAVLLPGRNILRRGNGGQSSAQIAARQGGMPILVDHAGIAAWEGTLKVASSFANGRGGFTMYGPGDVGVNEGGVYRWTTADPATIHSISLPFGTAIPAGSVVRVKLKLKSVQEGVNYTAGLRAGSTWTGGSWLFSSASAGLEIDQIRTVTSDCTDFTISRPAGASVENSILEIDNLEIIVMSAAQPAVAITGKNINTLISGGTYTGSMVGKLAGVPGTITTDASGNWTFTRTGEGPAIPAATGAPFVIDEAITLRERTAWLWGGRNDGATAPDFGTKVQAGIDAMTGYLTHDRFLVGAVLNQDTEPVGNSAYARIAAKNAELASRYGRRFVDVKAALMAAADPVRDAAFIAQDIPPAYFRSDGIHLNARGYGIVAERFVAAHRAIGW